MNDSKRLLVLIAASGLGCLARPAAAQTTSAAPVPVAAVPAPVAAAPAPVTAPAALPIPPPGYVLVPASAAYPTPPAAQPTEETPQDMSYETGQPIPAGYHVQEKVRRGLVIAGSLTLGIPWVLSATTAVGMDFEDKSGLLMIPALGPWLMLAAGGAADDCSTSTYDSSEYCSSNSYARAWLFLDGITQTAGAIMLAVGVGYPSTQLVRNQVAVSLAPTAIGRDGYGLGAIGTF